MYYNTLRCKKFLPIINRTKHYLHSVKEILFSVSVNSILTVYAFNANSLHIYNLEDKYISLQIL